MFIALRQHRMPPLPRFWFVAVSAVGIVVVVVVRFAVMIVDAGQIQQNVANRSVITWSSWLQYVMDVMAL